MRSLWNSLGQIVQGVARINYMKYRTLQAYYRFAPKRIEELLNKHSILDVEAKDSTHASGVLAVVSLPGEGKTQEKMCIRDSHCVAPACGMDGRLAGCRCGSPFYFGHLLLECGGAWEVICGTKGKRRKKTNAPHSEGRNERLSLIHILGGLEIARTARTSNPEVQVAFVTASEEYAV